MKDCKRCSKGSGSRKEPTNNCKRCWTRYFRINPLRYLVIKRAMDAGRKKQVEEVLGKKVTKHFERVERTNAVIAE